MTTRQDASSHPTTSGSSQHLTGILLGVSHDIEIKKGWNSLRFLTDLGSVPGSHKISIKSIS